MTKRTTEPHPVTGPRYEEAVQMLAEVKDAGLRPIDFCKKTGLSTSHGCTVLSRLQKAGKAWQYRQSSNISIYFDTPANRAAYANRKTSEAQFVKSRKATAPAGEGKRTAATIVITAKTPPPRFALGEDEELPRVINPAECRPWANVAARV
jgi:hypothetical protein